MKILKILLNGESQNTQEQEKSELNEKIHSAAVRLKADKKLLFIVILSVAAMLLILISELTDNTKSKVETQKEEITQKVSSCDYALDLEARLVKIISSIDGAGKSKVMITLENGEEQVYASDSKSDSEDSADKSGEFEKKSGVENKLVVVESDGNETGLIVRVIQPEIRGVAVVCEGADSPRVQRDIAGAVTAVLGISSARVSVTKMASDAVDSQ